MDDMLDFASADEAMTEAPEALDEIVDLIAEAARTSRHAAKAYDLLRQQYQLELLAARQRSIAGRMAEVA